MLLHSMDKLPQVFSTIFIKLKNFDRTKEYYLPKVKHRSMQDSPSHTLVTNWNKMISLGDKNIGSIKQKKSGDKQIDHLNLFTTSITQVSTSKYLSSIKCKNIKCRDCT